jgi:hypothetical protein
MLVCIGVRDALADEGAPANRPVVGDGGGRRAELAPCVIAEVVEPTGVPS